MTILICLIALAMSVVFFVVAGSFPHLAADPGGPALFPRIAAMITGLACILSLIQAVAGSSVTFDTTVRGLPGFLGSLAQRRAQLASFASILLLPVAISALGFVAATFFFVLVLMLLSRISIARSLVAAAVTTGVVYVGYALLLGAALPAGYLWT